MADIKLTVNEAKYLILKAMGLEATYRKDVIISNHTVEFTDGQGSRLENSAK
jgi:hypothetical protein